MATASTPTASIAIPSDIHSFAANVSPRGVDLEGRLDLSLDALIKERRKEHKLLKKQALPSDKRKTPKKHKEKQTLSRKNGSKAQRKTLMDKNRGLPTLPTAAKDKKIQGKTKTSIAATTAKLRRQMRADKAQKMASGRLVVSPRKDGQTTAAQQSKKKNVPQQTRKVTSEQPKNAKKLQTLKQQPKTQAKTSVRQVMRSNNKKAKLSITITGQTGKKKAQKKQQTTKVLLPGKVSQALAKKNSAAKKVVKRAKNRKASATKTVQIIRKVPGQRKKN